MTVGVVTSCSPAQWGVSRNGLCRARTGAPHWGNPNPPPHTQGPRRGHVEYWKAQCGETRMLRLEGGKERKLLPIRTKGLAMVPRRPPTLRGTSVRKTRRFLRTDVPRSQHSSRAFPSSQPHQLPGQPGRRADCVLSSAEKAFSRGAPPHSSAGLTYPELTLK